MSKGVTGMSPFNRWVLCANRTAVLICIIAGVSARAITPEDIGIELRNKATGTISVGINVVSPIRTEYRYTVRNELSSQRAIDSFNVQLNVPFDTTALHAPQGWTSRGCCVVDNKREGATGIRTTGWVYDASGALILPGAFQDGFVLEASSASVPTIVRYFIESFTDLDTPIGEPGDAGEEKTIINLTNLFNNSTSGFTLGPAPSPLLDIPALIGRLIDLKHRSASLGWIYGPGSEGIVKSLDAKLDAAKASVARSQNKAAVNQLNAFINELQAQRDKHINDNAFLLLKTNAEFIIGKLGP